MYCDMKQVHLFYKTTELEPNRNSMAYPEQNCYFTSFEPWNLRIVANIY